MGVAIDLKVGDGVGLGVSACVGPGVGDVELVILKYAPNPPAPRRTTRNAAIAILFEGKWSGVSSLSKYYDRNCNCNHNHNGHCKVCNCSVRIIERASDGDDEKRNITDAARLQVFWRSV